MVTLHEKLAESAVRHIILRYSQTLVFGSRLASEYSIYFSIKLSIPCDCIWSVVETRENPTECVRGT